MNRAEIFVALALAFASPAFAQDATQTNAPPAGDQSTSIAAPSTDTDTSNTATPPANASTADAPPPASNPSYDKANAALTGNEPKVVAYQRSHRVKRYPAKDHGHVAGDPPIIDHSADQEVVAPTSTSITVPANN